MYSSLREKAWSTSIGCSRPRTLSTSMEGDERALANMIAGDASIETVLAEGSRSPATLSREGKDVCRLATAAIELIEAGSADDGGVEVEMDRVSALRLSTGVQLFTSFLVSSQIGQCKQSLSELHKFISTTMKLRKMTTYERSQVLLFWIGLRSGRSFSTLKERDGYTKKKYQHQRITKPPSLKTHPLPGPPELPPPQAYVKRTTLPAPAHSPSLPPWPRRQRASTGP